MTNPSLRRKTLPLVLALALAIPWSAAAGPQRPRAAQAAAAAPLDLLSRSWAFLQSLWSEEGCRLDPNGHRLAGIPPKAHTDTGCRLDPNGHCIP